MIRIFVRQPSLTIEVNVTVVLYPLCRSLNSLSWRLLNEL